MWFGQTLLLLNEWQPLATDGHSCILYNQTGVNIASLILCDSAIKPCRRPGVIISSLGLDMKWDMFIEMFNTLKVRNVICVKTQCCEESFSHYACLVKCEGCAITACNALEAFIYWCICKWNAVIPYQIFLTAITHTLVDFAVYTTHCCLYKLTDILQRRF